MSSVARIHLRQLRLVTVMLKLHWFDLLRDPQQIVPVEFEHK